jgi:hypothetical protein
MGWKVPDLSDYLYAAARNGGPIGISTSLVQEVELIGSSNEG